MVSRLLGIFRKMKSGDDCEEVRGMSSDYIDGELNKPEVAKVRTHILNCGPCDTFINTLRATVGLLRSTPKQQPPSDFKQRIRDRLDQEQNN